MKMFNKKSPAIPRAVWALGLVSLCMDVSSEMIHGLLPLFLVGVLGASVLTLGLIEGVAEATASVLKVVSGVWSDRLPRRKPLALAGYALSALSKPLFPLAGSAAWILSARFLDRVGKGLRAAPRDAMVADLTPAPQRGAAYGLRQSLDTVGAFLGPLLAVALMLALAGDYRIVLWVAAGPAFLAVLILAWGVDEPRRSVAAEPAPRPRLQELRVLGPAFWSVVAVSALFTLARFSEAFLVLRAHDAGLAAALAPLALVVMNLAYAATAYPAGHHSDRAGRLAPLAAGVLVLVAANLLLAFGDGVVTVLAGVALWGVHLGLTQGLLAALVADAAPAAARGSAFGLFHLVTGLATLAASVIAGALWHAAGAPYAFATAAGFALLALAALPLLRGVRR